MNDGKYWDRAWSLVEGCSEVSEGCRNCWSAANSHLRRTNAAVAHRYHDLTTCDGEWNNNIRLMWDDLEKPLKSRKPAVWAIWNDIFHEDVPDEFIDRVFTEMALCPQHTFLILTKRPVRMREYFTKNVGLENRFEVIADLAERMGNIVWDSRGDKYFNYMHATAKDVANRRVFPGWPLPNVWLGVTAENQEEADKRIPVLLRIPAAHRFISYEPALGPVDLTQHYYEPTVSTNLLSGIPYDWDYEEYKRENKRDGLDWVIAGGETGHYTRPPHPDWFRGLRDQCAEAGVPFWFKAWGEFLPRSDIPEFKAPVWSGENKKMARKKYWYVTPDGHRDAVARFGSAQMIRVGRRAAGRMLDGAVHNGRPGF